MNGAQSFMFPTLAAIRTRQKRGTLDMWGSDDYGPNEDVGAVVILWHCQLRYCVPAACEAMYRSTLLLSTSDVPVSTNTG